tara:strand:- start:171 stop:428 length:258 start_codon:yes stop_codon:yes gene_type:complete
MLSKEEEEEIKKARRKRDEECCDAIKIKIMLCILCLLCLWLISLIVALIFFYFREPYKYNGERLNVKDYYGSGSGLGEFGGDTGS